MDCKYRIISSNNLGHVIACEDCNQLIIGLGTVILKFDPGQCRIFVQALQRATKNFNESGALVGDKIFLKTPVSNMLIAFNKQELQLGIELVEYALLRNEVDELIHI